MPQLDWSSYADRMFFLFAYMLPIATLVYVCSLFVEYKLEVRAKRKK